MPPAASSGVIRLSELVFVTGKQGFEVATILHQRMLREATIENLALLTEMNIALRADEQIDNEMSLAEVEARMRDFITGSQYQVFMIHVDSAIVGYAVVDVSRKPPYLRQFFIEASKRGQGLGTQALTRLRHLLSTDRLDVEVMIWNPRAIRFYEKNGFKTRMVGLRL